ncbi:MAG: glycosyl hydrolase family 43, partial [Bacteroidota bacterium]|nr:glycosyl hydrolase family 43 [Bacteroidota bacterium]
MKVFFVSLLLILCAGVYAQNHQFQPGAIWRDSKGAPINAHGGGMLYHNGKYYWFGEIKQGITKRVAYVTSWEDYRVDAGGIACYSSTDLYNWEPEGVALAAETSDTSSPLHS